MKQKFSASSLISSGARYGSAVLLVCAALTLTLLIWVFVKPIASPLFLVAIMITAWRSGLRAGIFATIISGFIIDYFFITPQYQLSGGVDDIVRLSVFTLEGVVLCWLVAWRTTAAEEIRNSREHLQALSLRQQTLREDERKRIALEIHDELGQALTGLKMEIHLLNRQIKDSGHPAANSLNDRIKDLLHLTDGTIQTVRRIATELRPPILDDLGLAAAIEWQAQEFARRTGISCVVSTNVETDRLDSDFSTAVFRIFQETLTNVIRHASANTITVNLKKLDQKLILRVEDDGTGIQMENSNGNGSLGILGMHERARLIGGELEVFNGAENGTIVLLTAPLR
ncbi:MAG: sensor histidine kinase [Acidobacteriota bacterium]|nr:sensor histidine kinase [Acidobacteriota bacterium]